MLKHFLLLVFVLFPVLVKALEWESEVGFEMRSFPNQSLEHQARNHGSAYVQPEIFHESENGKHIFNSQFFFRYDQRDSLRTHGDIRELNYTYVKDNWDVQLGIGKVFWGVAESRHLIDIINQTDLIENPDEEDKLGQPMLKASLVTESGTFTGFILPFFRERTFPGSKGRLRTMPVVDKDLVIYESTRQKKHLDWAARWSHSLDIWDVGLSAFHGTSREPRFIPAAIGLTPKLAPLYDIITQYSLDVQATIDAWLWKFEGYRRQNQGPTYHAMVAGFEYTWYGIFDTPKDIGLVTEYHYDSRNRLSPQPFNDDLALGARLAFNDIPATEILVFTLIDRHHSSRSYRIEASRRLAQNFKVSLEASLFDNISKTDPLYVFRNDSYFQLNLTYHFSS